MRTRSAALYFAAALMFASVPLIAAAQGTGLVPCNGLDCQMCHFVSLAQNLVNFLIGISIPIAVVLIAWAGVLLFTSSALDKVALAKKILWNAIIGFLIALSGWLVVQTVLFAIFKDSYYKNWNTIQCVSDAVRPKDTSIGQLINSLLGAPQTKLDTRVQGGNPNNFIGSTQGFCKAGEQLVTGNGGSSLCYNPTTESYTAPSLDRAFAPTQYGCRPGWTEATDELGILEGGGVCIGPNGETEPPSLFPGTSRGDCTGNNIASAAAAGGYNLTAAQANTLACLAVVESNCGNYTNVPTTPQGIPTSATGQFQIVLGLNTECHNLNLNVCADAARSRGYQVTGNLNCSSAFLGGQPRRGMEQLASACRAAAFDLNCSASAAACLLQKNPSYGDWTADPRNSKQKACIAQYN